MLSFAFGPQDKTLVYTTGPSPQSPGDLFLYKVFVVQQLSQRIQLGLRQTRGVFSVRRGSQGLPGRFRRGQLLPGGKRKFGDLACVVGRRTKIGLSEPCEQIPPLGQRTVRIVGQLLEESLPLHHKRRLQPRRRRFVAAPACRRAKGSEQLRREFDAPNQ